MDIISFNEASTANGRIESFIENPDSTSGVLTVPKTIAAGETITIPAGRVAILPDLQVDGDLVVDGDLFIPTGSMTSQVVQKVASTDNAVVRFNGTTGQVQDSSILIDDGGNLNITGVGKRITGDFSDSTISNRVAFQSSTNNSNTILSAIPNGTATEAYFSVRNNSDADNASNTSLGITAVASVIGATKTGTGSYLPLAFFIGGPERMRIDTEGNVGIGTSSPTNSKFGRTFTTQVTGFASVAMTTGDYSALSGSTVTAVESLGNRNDGNGTFGGRFGASFRRSDGLTISAGNTIGYYAFGGQWGTDVGYTPSKHLYTASICGVTEGAFTSATAMPTGISFRTGSTGESLGNVNTTYGTERMRIDSSGNVLLTSATGGIGYGTGAGGTVTQLTSKSTAVTLNKPCGQITMNNSALAPNTKVAFLLYNSNINVYDNIHITVIGGSTVLAQYEARGRCADGVAEIVVSHTYQGTLSESIILTFTVLKGANS